MRNNLTSIPERTLIRLLRPLRPRAKAVAALGVPPAALLE